MKKLLIGLALTATAVTPSFAAGYQYRAADTTVTGPTMPAGSGAYAYAPGQPNYIAPVPGAVFVNGEYQGADPDPLIRLQLRRDPPTFMK